MQKLKSWWSADGQWFCVLVNDGVSQATVSLTPVEAAKLAFSIAYRAVIAPSTDAPEAVVQSSRLTKAGD
jgi:hypothetical protein